ncbi:carbohydrate porin [Kiritimatiellaeota bacterium B1221]|nr:carbohydrate porin [Kiritimatiellaeota bacterium B1221]
MKKNKLIWLCVLFAARMGVAQESTPQQWTAYDPFLADALGVSETLAESPFTPFAYYNFIVADNVSGGIEEDNAFAGDLYFGTTLDLEKKWGWEGVVFKISGIERHGRSIDAAVGSQYSTMQLVGGQNIFLYEFNLEKSYENGVAVKLGRTTATDDFVGSPLYSYSLNNAVNGQIRAVLFDGVMTSYPFAVWGGRFKYQPNTEHKLQVGVYQLTDEMWDRTNNGLDFSIDGDDGVSLFTQYDWTPVIAERSARFYIGMNNAFWDKENLGGDSDHFVRFYGHAEIEAVKNMWLFTTLAYTDQEDVAIIPLQSTVGIHSKGLFASRPEDRTVLFATWGEFSEEEEGKSSEVVYEAGHRLQITPSVYAQPSIQYIQRPGGTGDIDDAVVLGIQAGVTLF